MLPNHFRTQDEIDGVDTTTYSVEWREQNGRGELLVRHEVGEVVGTVAHAEPITARTDSHEVAAKVVSALGMRGPAWVDHSGGTIYFAQESR